MTHQELLIQSIVAQLPLLSKNYLKKIHDTIVGYRKELEEGEMKNKSSEGEESEFDWSADEWELFMMEIEERKKALKEKLGE